MTANELSQNVGCALILWRSVSELLMDKVRQFLTELSARDISVFSFQDNKLSKFQWIFAKLDFFFSRKIFKDFILYNWLFTLDQFIIKLHSI